MRKQEGGEPLARGGRRDEAQSGTNLGVKRDVAHGLLDLSDNLPLRAGVEVVASVPQQRLQVVCHIPVVFECEQQFLNFTAARRAELRLMV